MSTVLITPLSHADLPELSLFEHSNRLFFEKSINARPEAFYASGGIAASIDAAVHDALHDKAYQFLVRTLEGQLVGRVNMHNVRRQHFQAADVGYRIAQSHNGKGYASQAVQLVVQHAFGVLELHRVEACVSHINIGSQAVLLRNGFTEFGRSTRSFNLQGTWLDLLYFERHAKDAQRA